MAEIQDGPDPGFLFILSNNVRFGFVTTECTDEVRQQASEAGAEFFMTKPFTPEKLEAQFNSEAKA